MSKPKTVREIPFADIESRFELAQAVLGAATVSPAVGGSQAGDGYFIRIVTSRRAGTTTYGYFRLAHDGFVTEAPRGYAREFRPARITGLAEAVERYAGGAR